MPTISTFDMFKIGVGPSSSHTLGPWRIVQRFLAELPGLLAVEATAAPGARLRRVRFELLGSLALTGHGHGTDRAITLAVLGEQPECVDVGGIGAMIERAAVGVPLSAAGVTVAFDPGRDIVFLKQERDPRHANALRCVATLVHPDDPAGSTPRELARTYFSLGGGFIASPEELGGGAGDSLSSRAMPPVPIRRAADLLRACRDLGLRVSDVVHRNELAWFEPGEIRRQAMAIWRVMRCSAARGCTIEGTLPGGLEVSRRAPGLLSRIDRRVLDIARAAPDAEAAADAIVARLREAPLGFDEQMSLVSCLAIAVNEENAAMGRIVTAPTNGAAGVIPAVMLHRDCTAPAPVGAPAGAPGLSEDEVVRFLLVAGQIGALFKLNATISAAMGGCQAEVGVSSAMAAAGLAEIRGATPEQVLMAAEIAMEHHLGMTCDPVGGLVQVPCIERNAMGATKAIAAAVIAGQSDASRARVSLDQVIDAMWETAQKMGEEYKETALGGLAIRLSISVGHTEC